MSSLRAPGLFLGLTLSLLAVPVALADDPAVTTMTETGEMATTAGTTTETTQTTATTTTEPTTTAETPLEQPPPDPWAETAETRQLRAQALRSRRIARRLHALMGRPRPHLPHVTTPFESLLERRLWQARAWRAKARAARRRAAHPPHLRAWRCIHRYEGSWRDPNEPYYGGLQMNLTFQRRYGRSLLRRKGTADHWTPAEQMWVAERALRAGRGFYPWPVTARRCGLL